jgi:SAM-dependent methyltransferase
VGETGDRRFKERIRDRFDARARAYEDGRESDAGFRRQATWILEAAGRGAGRTVLEVGCGAGSLLQPLRERGFRSTAMDLSAAMVAGYVRRARRLGLAPRVVRADAEDLPFAESAFDAVVAIGLLEYLPAPRRFLREARRVLRPGGSLLLSVPAAGSPNALAAGAFRALPAGIRARILGRRAEELPAASSRPVGAGRLRRELSEAGLRPGARRYSRFVCFPWNRLALRSSERVAGWLEPLGRVPILGRLGSQLLMAAHRPPEEG